MAGLRPPLLGLALGFTALALLAMTMVVLLVHRIRRGTVLARSSLFRVDLLIAALLGGVVLAGVGFVIMILAPAGHLSLLLAQLLVTLVLAALAALTLVLRALLRHAISLRSELDEVV